MRIDLSILRVKLLISGNAILQSQNSAFIIDGNWVWASTSVIGGRHFLHFKKLR